jgi:transcriptional regulator with XRE-family HTH domain
MTGISNGALSRIENGKKNIEFVTISKLADALEVELVELFKFPKKTKESKQLKSKKINQGSQVAKKH